MRHHETFYEEFPMGLMTPTYRPGLGCGCRKGKSCYTHGQWEVMKMLLALWDDIIVLMSHVPCEEVHGYISRYEWLLDHLVQLRQRPEPKKLPPRPEPKKLPQRREPERLTVAALAGTRRFVSNR